MLKKLILVLMITSYATQIDSQNLTFGGTGNIGLSKIISISSIANHSDTKLALSGNIGAYLEKRFTINSCVGIEFLWVQIEGRETSDQSSLVGSNGQVIGIISEELKLHTSYLGLPIYYRFFKGKVGIKIGVQPMFFLFASSDYKANGELNNEPFAWQREMKNIEFEKFQIGTKFGIDYQLNDIFILRIDYFHGLTDISTSQIPSERKNRQFTLGIQYTFDNLISYDQH